ncbi:MAG: efflux RND transporter periplasmic adaptor subunit [Betaproteobacteria bacterium]|nr:efflux RND transporter periplasmic adaptor subunit [Betaproteobacteria bacterium]MBU6512873.1 efflux RND transporter periplasmic adaptor subunit [Betaproteobacteria bacterium]MDE1955202.1 efflux RND transporter periplasmic adaptor subunit [Betaproteobacteria bacterium]MDE2153843.1 efflux RND transporter periplasmic adaptor subunit [Betaproteobacteria bacterium]MDE2477371.1 efflux RND transporter periplasmic adaptor subunit [Betaproteobacteria bacterium]
MIIMLVIAAVLIGAVTWFHFFKGHMIAKYMKAMSNPPQTVSTAVARLETWQPTVEALGTLRASKQASLSTPVGALVTAIRFDSGAHVRAGQDLVELDPAPLRAQLQQLQAQEQLAQLNLKRDEAQLKVQAISQAVVDTDQATLRADQAGILAQKALLAQHIISAPFAGRLGLRQVDLGQYLAPGGVAVTLQKLDPMQIDFNVPQNQIELIHVGMKAELSTSAVPGKSFAAKVIAIEPQVDTATRNLTVRAEVPNPGEKLLPGVFASIRLDRSKPQQYLTLPNAAIIYNPYGETVYLVKDEGKGADGKPRLVAEQRFITTGAQRGDQVAIVKGLKPGDTVVTSGQLKLRNGTPLLINNSVEPSDSPDPTVPDS